jgi:hypothetical protein
MRPDAPTLLPQLLPLAVSHSAHTDQPMRRYLVSVAVGLAVGWATWPFVAAAWKPNHPDDDRSTYWGRVRDGYWWRMRKLGRPGHP